MSSFTDAEFEPVPGKFRGGWRRGLFRWRGRQVYRATAPFWFYIGNPNSRFGIDVREGFEGDLSLPWWADICPPLVRRLERALIKSAALHDRMREDLQFNLVDCDALFLVAMKADRVPAIIRETAFLLVRTNSSRIKHNSPV